MGQRKASWLFIEPRERLREEHSLNKKNKEVTTRSRSRGLIGRCPNPILTAGFSFAIIFPIMNKFAPAIYLL
jgi:hypothetical protein